MSLLIFLSVTLFSIASVWFLIEFILHKYKVNKMMSNVKLLDGALPIVGNIFFATRMKCNTPEEMFKVMSTILDGMAEDKRIWLGNHNVLLAVRLQTIEKILASQETVEKSYFYKSFSSLSGGVFSAPVDKWRRLRKRLNTTFNPKFFPRYIDLMNYQASILVERLKHNGITKDYQNIHPILNHYFFDIITSTHFGINTKQQEKEDENVSDVISRCTEIVLKRVSRPWLHFDFMFAMTDLNRRLKESIKSYEDFMTCFPIASEKYQRTIDAVNNTTGWKSYSVHVEEVLKEIGSDATPAVTGNTVVDLLVAGSDTSGVVLSVILYYLGLYPEYQERAYNEVVEIMNQDYGSNRSSHNLPTDEMTSETVEQSHQLDESSVSSKAYPEWEFATFFPDGNSVWTKNKLERMTYLDMLIKESARQTSPPMICRCLKSNLDVGDYTIPKGSNIMISLRNLHRNPEYFERPDEFYPEHFSKERVKERPKMAFIPFSYGPRDCPGKAFGTYAIKCALAEILRCFKVETKPVEQPVTYKYAFMVEHSQGYPIKLVPR